MTTLKDGDHVLDLGSGSGMDTFISALKVGTSGKVAGVDMTDEQLEKASNGVINLAPDKERVFAEVSRVLKPGGRMMIRKQ